ncbi:hypothetical protein K470DRAFT_79937 [Piedraia hortae CBS 480.64]|uniref:Uncharacterized protein n=1 Tax=Piedraia hortae CBS 480.64 TaxID=1314780 RepID=A0A6A7C033_9PEZI|nr:hypothetical protein K470DRAFT_79937 [Piedraia hortae CBS 480.64]
MVRTKRICRAIVCWKKSLRKRFVYCSAWQSMAVGGAATVRQQHAHMLTAITRQGRIRYEGGKASVQAKRVNSAALTNYSPGFADVADRETAVARLM